MSHIDIGVAMTELSGLSNLYRDFVLRRETPVHAALGDFRSNASDWRRGSATPAVTDARLVERMVTYNRERGASEDVLSRLAGLADGSVRAVVTGQQPGVAGGPLMTLHKIATARALAHALEARDGMRCVPLFWMGSDDDDFAEMRELATLSAATALVSVWLGADVTSPGRRVGDIAARAVADVWNTVAPLLPDSAGIGRAAMNWMADAGDLGDAAARCTLALCGGEVAVVDGREPLLRECTRDLLLAYFDREEALRATVVAAGERLTRDGYHAQIDPGESSGLFLVEDGVRMRVPAAQRATARSRFVADIHSVSPGVVARNLVQDAALRPLAVVLGPAEIAYRAQLVGVYEALSVPRPVVFPRMMATFVPPAVRDLLENAGMDPSVLAVDPASTADSARTHLRDEQFAGAARSVRRDFEELGRRFGEAASSRLDARAREKLEKRLADVGHRLAQALEGAVEQDGAAAAARYPFLSSMTDLFTRAGAPQERYLSMTAPYSCHGPAAWERVRAAADAYCVAALDGRVAHRVYSL